MDLNADLAPSGLFAGGGRDFEDFFNGLGIADKTDATDYRQISTPPPFFESTDGDTFLSFNMPEVSGSEFPSNFSQPRLQSPFSDPVLGSAATSHLDYASPYSSNLDSSFDNHNSLDFDSTSANSHYRSSAQEGGTLNSTRGGDFYPLSSGEEVFRSTGDLYTQGDAFDSTSDPFSLNSTTLAGNFDHVTLNSGLGSGGTCEVVSSSLTGMDESRLQFSEYGEPAFDSNPDPHLDPSTSVATARKPKSSKSKETGLTEEEKYFRIRDQNNESSRQYRQRKKCKRMGMELRFEQLIKENQQLHQVAATLENKHEHCLKIKSDLEKLGFDLSNFRLT